MDRINRSFNNRGKNRAYKKDVIERRLREKSKSLRKRDSFVDMYAPMVEICDRRSCAMCEMVYYNELSPFCARCDAEYDAWMDEAY